MHLDTKLGLGFLGGNSTCSSVSRMSGLSLFAPWLPGVLTSSGTWPCSSADAITGDLVVLLAARGRQLQRVVKVVERV